MKPGPGMFISRYLEKKGDGINHIAFNTNDIERDTKYFIDRGCELVFNVTTNGKTIENYIDTRLHGDLMISLRPSGDDWEKSWRKNNESHPPNDPPDGTKKNHRFDVSPLVHSGLGEKSIKCS